MLTFLGTGSCFNTKLGNNSAYFIDNNILYLLDCGGDVFGKIKDVIDSNPITDVYVFITHLHSDHVGSLPDLIFYMYFKKNKEIKLICLDSNIFKLLRFMGVIDKYYDYRYTFQNNPIGNYTMTPFTVEHDKTLYGKCYGYLFMKDNFKFYFSGDSKNIPNNILKMLENKELNLLYQDVSTFNYENSIHLSLDELCELIKPEYRDRVWCMHLDEYFDGEKVKNLGFNVVNKE